MAGFPATILRARERRDERVHNADLARERPGDEAANTNMSAGANCHYAEIRVVQLRPELFGEHLLVLPAFSRLKVD